ncbi:MAG: lysine--tRNA ligase [Candidatus Puniceispirillaceae bacterium]
MSDIAAYSNFAEDAKSWPFAEARALRDRLQKMGHDPAKPVLFETGYGPSGLPHIGTFGEVVRTSFVRHAFETLTGWPTRLICFSDDMDGLRKVPDNIPNPEKMAPYLNQPLTMVPDPFGTHDSFGAHNNARLMAFLDSFGFEYEFISASDMYKAGHFDDALLHILRNHQAVKDIILPTLGAERQATYSPFLPVCPRTGQVLQVAITEIDEEAGTIIYADPETGDKVTQPVTGGHCKLQWKADWAMRWYALGVDYEMSGKDLIDSVTLSSKIVRRLGGTPPAGFSYELFLDQNGEKISKSKGNGLSVEEWLSYGTSQSLALFMYGQPKRAKRLYFDMIPKTVDEYFSHLEKWPSAEPLQQLDNPAWHIHKGQLQSDEMPVSFSLLLNLAGVCSADSPDVIWNYVASYAPGTSAETHPALHALIERAVRYYQDRVRPHKTYRSASEAEKPVLMDLRQRLASLPEESSAEDIMSEVYAAGKQAGYENLRDWFSVLYETMLGQTQGPRMGGFIKLYGLGESLSLIDDVLADKLANPKG